MTAAAFAKGLLDLDGPLTPILASLVINSNEANRLLDDSSKARPALQEAKQKVRKAFHLNQDVDSGLESVLAPTRPSSVLHALRESRNLPRAMAKLHGHVRGLTGQLREQVRRYRARFGVEAASEVSRMQVNAVGYASESEEGAAGSSGSAVNTSDESGSSEEGGSAAASLGVQDLSRKVEDRGDGAVTFGDMLQLSFARWAKLEKDFFKKKEHKFDISKIPDIADCVRYDMVHNPIFLNMRPPHMREIYRVVKRLSDIVVPLEYGATAAEKADIAGNIGGYLLEKISRDMRNAMLGRRRDLVHTSTYQTLNPSMSEDSGLSALAIDTASAGSGAASSATGPGAGRMALMPNATPPHTPRGGGGDGPMHAPPVPTASPPPMGRAKATAGHASTWSMGLSLVQDDDRIGGGNAVGGAPDPFRGGRESSPVPATATGTGAVDGLSFLRAERVDRVVRIGRHSFVARRRPSSLAGACCRRREHNHQGWSRSG